MAFEKDIPFLLLNPDDGSVDRGYLPASSYSYDPVSQTTDAFAMGSTSPTTMSSVSTWLSGDDENGQDDKGED